MPAAADDQRALFVHCPPLVALYSSPSAVHTEALSFAPQVKAVALVAAKAEATRSTILMPFFMKTSRAFVNMKTHVLPSAGRVRRGAYLAPVCAAPMTLEEARLLLPVPDPAPHGCTGACVSQSEYDEVRAADPARYCDWVLTVDDASAVATVASAWRLDSADVLWCTGLTFEHIMALSRRAALLLRSEGLTADEALAARNDLRRAAALAAEWDVDPEVFEHAPDASSAALERFALVAWACAHALAVAAVGDVRSRAGLWRSIARALQAHEPTPVSPASDAALYAAAVYAECEALKQSADAHFEACRAGAARACAARALERARAVHHETPHAVFAARVEALQAAFDRFHAVAKRVEGAMAAGRVFDASLLIECVPLPEV